MQTIIRPATSSDALGISRVRVETWRTAYRGIISQNYLEKMDIQADAERQKEYLTQADSARQVLVAEVPGPFIAGFCGGGRNRAEDAGYTAELYALYILPQYQRQGIGKELFEAMGEWLRRQGHSRMILYVLRDNFPSCRFYEAAGGKAVRERSVQISGQTLPEVGYGYELIKT